MRRKMNKKGLAGTLLLIGVGVAAFVGYRLVVGSSTGTIYNLLRSICIAIDVQIYSISAFAYSIFYEISSSSLLSSLNLASASQRLYTLLGIFMLFRLAFSFVKYIINPDGMDKGTSKLLTNLAVSLALIVSVPWIFNRAFALQTYIMESNVIGNLIMGIDTSNESNSFNASSYGQTIGFLTFSAFYRPDSTIPSLSDCSNLLSYYSKYVIPVGDREVGIDDSVILSDSVRKESEKIKACVNALNDDSLGTEGVELGTILYIASQRQDIGLLTNESLLHAVVNNQYVIQYTAIVSAIAGGFLAWLFLCFSFDVAIRNVKLCFLQIIAPIPIILNIEPGDTKSDKKPLNWWAKECLNTYTLLFIRVATVYFGVFLINLLFGSGTTVVGSNNTSVWFQIFMILGILMFVKEIPDMIGKAFGIDVKGQFNLNPLKRIGDNKIASSVLGGAAGLVGGAVGGGIAGAASAWRASGDLGYNGFKRFGSALSGGLNAIGGGAARSAYSGSKKGVKSIHDITSNISENTRRRGQIAGANVGTTISGRLSTSASMALGMQTDDERIQNEAKAFEEYSNAFGNMKSFALTSKENVGIKRFAGGGYTVNAGDEEGLKLYKKDLHAEYERTHDASILTELNDLESRDFKRDFAAGTRTLSRGNTTGSSFGNIKDANDYLERLRASGASESDIKAAEDMVSQFVNNYIDVYKGVDGHAVNTMWTNAQDTYEAHRDTFDKYGVNRAETSAELKATITPAKSAAITIKSGDEARRAQRNKAAVQARRGGK